MSIGAQGMTVYCTADVERSGTSAYCGYGVDDHPSKWPGHKGDYPPPLSLWYSGKSVKGMEFQPDWEVIHNINAKSGSANHYPPMASTLRDWMLSEMKKKKLTQGAIAKALGANRGRIRYLFAEGKGCEPVFCNRVVTYIKEYQAGC